MYEIASSGWSWSYSPERSYQVDGKEYVVRDALFSRMKYAGFSQFKTRRADGCIVWKPCREGEEFASLEPYRSAS